MAGFWDKVSGVFFQEEEDVDNYEAVDHSVNTKEVKDKDVWQEPEVKKSKKTQLVSIPTANRSMEMVLIKAKSYNDMQTIAQHIKDRKVAIVNFEDMDKETAQRMVDFLSGAVFALDGVPKKVSGSTFLFSSSNVDLNGQIMEAEAGRDNVAETTFNAYNTWKNK